MAGQASATRYLLYWYKSTNTDALADQASARRYSVDMLYWYKSINTDALAAQASASTNSLQGSERGRVCLILYLGRVCLNEAVNEVEYVSYSTSVEYVSTRQ